MCSASFTGSSLCLVPQFLLHLHPIQCSGRVSKYVKQWRTLPITPFSSLRVFLWHWSPFPEWFFQRVFYMIDMWTTLVAYLILNVYRSLITINSIHPSIQFTAELENEDVLPFLDTLVEWIKEGSLDIIVYRKQTHTDRYLHFRSNHPAHVKSGLIKRLFNRAETITLSHSNLNDERKHLCKVLNIKGYPRCFISNATAPTRKLGEGESKWLPRTIITILYIAVVSEEIRRVCWGYDVHVAFKTGRTLHSKLARLKDPLQLEV